ncbi:MFS general substrate transporter [Pseudovirgaria hyperparasitica]|uniref:MFS general substrate transporter n=1 Tax=Pseudovirgaria hyperparasitica TaxID=470096 RepID=A0A6A6VZP6_9PEZI|nr:MFS general substrate transporter [Pseudovirgaria hyperparasitica]KAF2755725.1 MFS general substrate transporter [Pseudovirgaria hyperparasitica]
MVESRNDDCIKAKEQEVTWRSLPKKGQLALLTASRLSEPLFLTSTQSYMFYMLKSFDPSLSDSQIAQQTGIIVGAFLFAQFLTSFLWGTVSDSRHVGRKYVVLLSLSSTAVTAIGVGFSRSYASVVAFRVLGGVMNGNVGVMRTMISEIIKEKRFQSRAFLLLPLTFNVGVIIGPLLGGVLSDPIGQYPSLFGPHSTFGGDQGVYWMKQWPYALPNIVCAIFLITSSTAVFLGLDETHEDLQERPDIGRRFGRWLATLLTRRSHPPDYTMLATSEDDDNNDNAIPDTPTSVQLHTTALDRALPLPPKPPRQRLPFRRLFTRRVTITLLAHAFTTMHIGTFSSLWFVFLSTPRFDPSHPHPPSLPAQSPPFHFSGGLGLPPPQIGLSLAIVGTIGIAAQFLIYPRVTARLGTVRSYQSSLLLFPLAYALVPFLAVVKSTAPAPHHASGLRVWAAIIAVLAVQVCGRTFALPAAQILINNNCPHPSRLGSMHGIGQSVSAGTRTVGPVVFGWLLGRGLEVGIVGLAFWVLSAVSVLGAWVATVVREGDGHEIWLEGEKEEEEEGVVSVAVSA